MRNGLIYRDRQSGQRKACRINGTVCSYRVLVVLCQLDGQLARSCGQRRRCALLAERDDASCRFLLEEKQLQLLTAHVLRGSVRRSPLRTAQEMVRLAKTAPSQWMETIPPCYRSRRRRHPPWSQRRCCPPLSPLPRPRFGEYRSLLVHTPELVAPLSASQVSLPLFFFVID